MVNMMTFKHSITLIYRLFSSFGLACVILLLMLALTFFGTLEQIDLGIYDVQQKYFNSIILIHYLFDRIPLPLPGGGLLMTLLFINLICGGLLRIRKTWANAGLLITHVGIGLILVSGFITFAIAVDGYMTLYEKQSATVFRSYYEWEMVIWKVDENTSKTITEFIVPDRQFKHAAANKPVRFTAAALPFDLSVTHLLRNCQPMPKGPMFDVTVPVIDGVFLMATPPAKEAEQNIPGAYVTLTDKDTGQGHDGLIWGLENAPLSFRFGTDTWALHLRAKEFPLPFTIMLDKFTRELHPRTTIAKVFMSEISKIENGISESIKISMNEPLRHRGYTFFQASWGPQNAAPGEPLFSTFAVVRNPADQLPLYSCVIIGTGLFIHFTMKLIRYLRRAASRPRD